MFLFYLQIIIHICPTLVYFVSSPSSCIIGPAPQFASLLRLLCLQICSYLSPLVPGVFHLLISVDPSVHRLWRFLSPVFPCPVLCHSVHIHIFCFIQFSCWSYPDLRPHSLLFVAFAGVTITQFFPHWTAHYLLNNSVHTHGNFYMFPESLNFWETQNSTII